MALFVSYNNLGVDTILHVLDIILQAAASAANGGKSGSTWNRLASAGTKSSFHATAKPTAPTAGAAPTAPATSVTALPVSAAPPRL